MTAQEKIALCNEARTRLEEFRVRGSKSTSIAELLFWKMEMENYCEGVNRKLNEPETPLDKARNYGAIVCIVSSSMTLGFVLAKLLLG